MATHFEDEVVHLKLFELPVVSFAAPVKRTIVANFPPPGTYTLMSAIEL